MGWTRLLNLIAVREARYAPEEVVGIAMSGVFAGALVGPIRRRHPRRRQGRRAALRRRRAGEGPRRHPGPARLAGEEGEATQEQADARLEQVMSLITGTTKY